MKYGKIVEHDGARWLEHFTENAEDVIKIHDMKSENKRRNDDGIYRNEQQPIHVRVGE